MSNQRTHYVTTTDGVIIGGTVHGEGPPLVFLQGAVGDGDIDWARLVEHLTGRFTCHLPSMRGRGLSGDHPDLSPGRRAEDILTYIDSIEQPTGLVGWSGGANSASPWRSARWAPRRSGRYRLSPGCFPVAVARIEGDHTERSTKEALWDESQESLRG